MSKEVAIEVKNISKKYLIGAHNEDRLRYAFGNIFKRQKKEEVWALKDVSFTINKGEVVGIIGKNGAGKSTLLKILSKITRPTTGEVRMYGRVASLLEVGTGFHHELTGRENIFLNGSLLGLTRQEIKSKLDEIINFSGIDRYIDTPVKHYSSGMYVRLAFAVAAHLEPEILLIDEVLAVGDYEFQQKCLGKMDDVARSGRTVVVVSHNMGQIDQICTRCVLVDKGSILDQGIASSIINTYLNEQSYGKKRFEQGSVSSIHIEQKSGYFLIVLSYQNYKKENHSFPHLGVVISDFQRRAILGLNPTLLKDSELPLRFSTNGNIYIKLMNPGLVRGRYFLSYWFGNGHIDLENEEFCLSFDVIEDDENIFALKNVGYIKPKFTYEIGEEYYS